MENLMLLFLDLMVFEKRKLKNAFFKAFSIKNVYFSRLFYDLRLKQLLKKSETFM